MAHSFNWATERQRRRIYRQGTLPTNWGSKVARRTVTKPPKDTHVLPYDEVARRLIARQRSI